MKLNLLLAEGTGFSFAAAWPLLLLLVLFIGLMIFNVFSNKKRQAEYEKKLDYLKDHTSLPDEVDMKKVNDLLAEINGMVVSQS